MKDRIKYNVNRCRNSAAFAIFATDLFEVRNRALARWTNERANAEDLFAVKGK